MIIHKIIKTLLLVLFLHSSRAQAYVGFTADIEHYARLLNLPTLAIAVAKEDSLIFFHGIGSAAIEAQVPITPDHIFAVASITKSFTSVALQQLEADGKISLNDAIDKYPNKYFTRDRWTSKTTLAHIVSQTSESRPEGTNFVYNGSRYNIAFNAFAAVGSSDDTENFTHPFTSQVERRILVPLNMNHTLVRYTEAEHSHLKKLVVTPYIFNDSAGKYFAQAVDLSKMECGPGYGMLSSVNDLVKYSRALDKGTIVSKQRFKKITTPFYPGSPYGEGWFTTKFEGIDICWAYGFGNSDAAILLKVPSLELTFVLLSACSMPSATTRLGYGNPLNSPIVCSFIRNFVLNRSPSVKTESDVSSIVREVQINVRQNKSRVYIEEAFANATVSLFSPITTVSGKEEATQLLKLLVKNFPNDAIWQSETAFEVMATTDDDTVLHFASAISKNFYKAKNLHPAKLFFAGVIQEKSGNIQGAIQLFKKLADGDAYNEQSYKFDALMKLAKHFEKTDPKLSKYYLGNLIKYKEYISVHDGQYKEAIEMFSK